MVFQSAVFLIFLLAEMGRRLVRRVSGTFEDLVLLMINPFVFFATAYHLLNTDHHDWMGVFAIGMALLYAGAAKILLTRHATTQTQLLYMIAVALTFVTLAIPIQLKSNWITIGNQRNGRYTNLPGGTYTLRLRGSNSDGAWNNNGTSIKVTVVPPFWETWWFKTGLAILLLTLFAFAIAATMRRRHRLQLERLERTHEVERERSRIARDLHDDIGTSLTRINLLSGLVSHEQTPPSEVKDLTRQIRATSRKIVSELNEIVWAVNPKNDKLNELLGYVGNFAENFCRNTPLRCRLKFAEDLPDPALSSEVRHNLFLAFKEAVNNAVKHAGADELWVRARVEHHGLILTVEDNGTGLAVNWPAPGTGQGLNNMHQRLQRIGGQCTIRKNGERGTIVEFRLPLGA